MSAVALSLGKSEVHAHMQYAAHQGDKGSGGRAQPDGEGETMNLLRTVAEARLELGQVFSRLVGWSTGSNCVDA